MTIQLYLDWTGLMSDVEIVLLWNLSISLTTLLRLWILLEERVLLRLVLPSYYYYHYIILFSNYLPLSWELLIKTEVSSLSDAILTCPVLPASCYNIKTVSYQLCSRFKIRTIFFCNRFSPFLFLHLSLI